MVLTGLSLHAAAPPGWSLFASFPVKYVVQGRVHLIHLIAAVFFASSIVPVLLVYLRRKGRHRATHLTLLIGGLAMLVSAVFLLYPLGTPVVYRMARLVHAVTGLAVLPVTYLWHVYRGLGRGRALLWPAFHPWAGFRLAAVVCYLPIAAVVACLVLSGLPIRPSWNNLVAKRIEPVASEDADLTALPWSDAPALRIELANGIALHGGQTQVTLRALYDDNELFVLAEWTDPTENRRYQPWQKTADGWKHLVSNFEDESVFYEDKFSLVFPIEPDWQFERFGCATYCHLGGGRAYGYKAASRDADVWHWKATRTDPVGQVDDKFWTGGKLSELMQHKDFGRRGDPKEDGGYTKNFSDEKNHPDFLPDDLSSITQGIIPRANAVPYTTELAAKIPVETIIPGIVASAAVGDRGDVHCQSRHESGRWQLVIRRKLQTGSPHDVQFEPGGTYSFGCAAFDNTSKRHAYGLVPYRLVLQP